MHKYANESNRELVVWEGFGPAKGQTGRSAHPPSAVEIPTDGLLVTPFDCFYYPPPEVCSPCCIVAYCVLLQHRFTRSYAMLLGNYRQLAADGYKILNAAWTPLYIAGGSGQSPELIYSWNPYLLGEFPGV